MASASTAAAATATAAAAARALRSRGLKLVFEASEEAEGMGAVVRRSVGTYQLRNLDPFLMLDHFSITKPAGFPDHPHRGFETVTYMFKGGVTHEDFAGHRGELGPGDVQWMTAGRGIYHSELPKGDETASGLQLWINLPAKHKMVDPQYQEYKASEIPVAKEDGVTAIVVAGEALGTKSKIQTRIPVHYVRFQLEPNKRVFHPFPASWNSMVYVINGSATVGSDTESGAKRVRENLRSGHVVVLDGDGDGVLVRSGSEGADVMFLGGEPIGEPISQHGPVVMNTREEIIQAFRDIQNGRNGFERAVGWESDQSRRFLRDRRMAGQDADEL